MPGFVVFVVKVQTRMQYLCIRKRGLPVLLQLKEACVLSESVCPAALKRTETGRLLINRPGVAGAVL